MRKGMMFERTVIKPLAALGGVTVNESDSASPKGVRWVLVGKGITAVHDCRTLTVVREVRA